MPKISIIVPIYNVEKYLRKCIDSILAQTFNDFELILVDDGSPDNCGKICDEYAQKDSRIVVVHKENGGVSTARNAGLTAAKGDYIGWVDGDDFIHPEMYEILFEVMSKESADIVQCSKSDFKEDDPVNLNAKLEYNITHISHKEIYSAATEVNPIYNFNVWSKLFRRELFDGLQFPEGYIFEDGYLYLDLASRAESIVLIDCPLYFYLVRSGSITHNGMRAENFGYLYTLVHYLEVLEDGGHKKFAEKCAEKYCMEFFYLYYHSFGCENIKNTAKKYLKQFKTIAPEILKKYNLCRAHRLLIRTAIVSPKLAHPIYKFLTR